MNSSLYVCTYYVYQDHGVIELSDYFPLSSDTVIIKYHLLTNIFSSAGKGVTHINHKQTKE